MVAKHWELKQRPQMYFGKSAKNWVSGGSVAGWFTASTRLPTPLLGRTQKMLKQGRSMCLRLMYEKGWVGSDRQWHKISQEEYENGEK